MSLAPTIAVPGSLRAVWDRLVLAEESVHEDLRVYPVRPRTIDPPCIYNWTATPGTFEQLDLVTFRDTLDVTAYIVTYRTDEYEAMDKMFEYADAFRNVMDYQFRSNHRPLQGTATKGIRLGMALTTVTHDQEYLAWAMPIRLTLDRQIT